MDKANKPEESDRDHINLTEPPSPATWDYQPDPDVVETLRDTEQRTNDRDAAQDEYSSVSPVLSGGDVDADWERGEAVGEEAVGGTIATPDQDRVDDLGKAWGVEHQDTEPVHTIEKIQKRDDERWELDPRSEQE